MRVLLLRCSDEDLPVGWKITRHGTRSELIIDGLPVYYYSELHMLGKWESFLSVEQKDHIIDKVNIARSKRDERDAKNLALLEKEAEKYRKEKRTKLSKSIGVK